MKIEVTFDRAAKQKFKQQCINRLQKFVQEIKKQQPQYNNKLITNTIIEDDYQKNSNKDKQSNIFQKCFNKQHKTEMVSTLANSECLESKENSRKIIKLAKQSKIIKQGMEIESYRSERLNIYNMKENVDKIMKKLEQSALKQTHEHQQLKLQINKTDHKVDRLIVYLSKKKLIQEDLFSQERHNINIDSVQHVKKQYSQIHRLTQIKSDNFELKFKKLEDKYNQIKKNSLYNRNLKANYSYFSFESTADSMTFRHN